MAGAPSDSGYPPLQSVPPRPQLSYTVKQQRQIVEALIADRENARYTSQVVRYRAGLSSLPPPPTPPEPAPPVDIEPAAASPAGAPSEPPLAPRETLVDFLAALFADDPAPAPVSEPEAGPATPEVPDHSDRREPAAASAASATGPISDGRVGGASLPPDRSAVTAGLAEDGVSSDQTTEVPVPPRSAVAARLAAGPDLIGELLDETVPQMPLPPGQSALAARLAAQDQLEIDVAAPLPAPRPAAVRPARAALPAILPAPPPIKPIVPVSAPMPPRPAERPDDRAAADGARAWRTVSASAAGARHL